jgi:hypothetical protein
MVLAHSSTHTSPTADHTENINNWHISRAHTHTNKHTHLIFTAPCGDEQAGINGRPDAHDVEQRCVHLKPAGSFWWLGAINTRTFFLKVLSKHLQVLLYHKGANQEGVSFESKTAVML